MDEKHIKDMLQLTLEHVQDEGNNRFFQHLLKLRIKECYENGTYCVIYKNDELAAFIRWKWVLDGAVLEAVLIRDVYRKQGYLDELWEKLLNLCRKRRVKKILSYAEKEDFLNLSFHEYLGFKLAENHNAEKYKWVYEINDGVIFQSKNPGVKWLSVPDINGEL